MTALLLATGIGLLVLPGLLVHRWDHLSPCDWTCLNLASLRIGLWAVRVSLLLGAAPTILRAVGVEHAAVACHELVGPVLPGGAPIGWASVFAFASIQHRVHGSRRRTRAGLDLAWVEPWLGDHTIADGVDVVCLPTTEPFAYAVRGAPPQVVISEGLVAVLSDAELEAVVRHERSHLAHNHQRHLSVAAAADAAMGWLSPIRRSIEALRLGVERMADEDAATLPAERSLVRSALTKVTATMLSPMPSFTAGCTILDRLAALDRKPPTPTAVTRATAVAPLLGLTIIGGTLVTWSTFAHHGLLVLIGLCQL